MGIPGGTFRGKVPHASRMDGSVAWPWRSVSIVPSTSTRYSFVSLWVFQVLYWPTAMIAVLSVYFLFLIICIYAGGIYGPMRHTTVHVHVFAVKKIFLFTRWALSQYDLGDSSTIIKIDHRFRPKSITYLFSASNGAFTYNTSCNCPMRLKT